MNEDVKGREGKGGAREVATLSPLARSSRESRSNSLGGVLDLEEDLLSIRGDDLNEEGGETGEEGTEGKGRGQLRARRRRNNENETASIP